MRRGKREVNYNFYIQIMFMTDWYAWQKVYENLSIVTSGCHSYNHAFIYGSTSMYVPIKRKLMSVSA